MIVEVRWPDGSAVLRSFCLCWPSCRNRPQPPAQSSLQRPPQAAQQLPDPAAGSDSDETLFLDVQVNGHSISKIGEFTVRRGKLMARPDELRDLGFRVPESRASETGGLVALSDLPGITWVLDVKDQVLQATASDSALLPTLLQPYGREAAGERRVIESGTGVTLNYDISGHIRRRPEKRQRVHGVASLLASGNPEFRMARLHGREFAHPRRNHGDPP